MSLAYELASTIETDNGDGWHLGPSDAALAARALRSFAGRHLRRCAMGMLALSALAGLAVVGFEDRNGDGRVDWRDVTAIFTPLPG